ncbi:MAG: hypothetical protein KC649_00510 [Candidatus Omnitrophica bacterium]|nr:hypothetical protein [Candidatus Omnitrophota bacterium]
MISFLALGLMPASAHATFDLAVTADRGGREIRFDPAKPGKTVKNEEFTVTINTDIGKKYRVVLKQFDPLNNQWGAELSRDAVKYFSPSSVGGDNKIVFPTALRTGEEEIYYSDNLGTGVSFSLAFALEVSPSDGPGQYRSQVIFELQDLEGSTSPSTVVKNMIVEVDTDYNLQLRSEHGGRAVDLGKVDRNNREGEAVVSLTLPAAIGGQYSIYQRMINTPTNPNGKRIDSIFAQISKPATGSSPVDVFELDESRQLLYTSAQSGEGVELVLRYFTKDASNSLAGLYEGSVQYEVETSSSAAFFSPLNAPIRLDIEPIFDLEVIYDRTSPLYFGKFTEPGEQQRRKMELKITANTGEQYQVLQNIRSGFTNEKGYELPMDQLTVTTGNAVNGKTKFISGGHLKPGDNILFTSDPYGSSDNFVVEYLLELPVDAKKGDYTSETTYSLSAL